MIGPFGKNPDDQTDLEKPIPLTRGMKEFEAIQGSTRFDSVGSGRRTDQAESPSERTMSTASFHADSYLSLVRFLRQSCAPTRRCPGLAPTRLHLRRDRIPIVVAKLGRIQ
jgi:hypothetical protein